MAFNPFHKFRKHSKVIFAILTIVCMFMFVLSSGLGQGDFFQWFVGLFGAGRKGEVVTTLYGKKIYQIDLDERRADREDADLFAFLAINLGHQKTTERARADLNKLVGTSEIPNELAEYRDQLRYALVGPYVQQAMQGREIPQDEFIKALQEKDPTTRVVLLDAKDLRRGRPGAFEALLPYFRVDRPKMEELRERLLKQDRTDEARVLAGLLGEGDSALQFDPAKSKQDLLDSMVWLHQADSLGIRLVEADIRTLVNRVSPAEDILTGDSKRDLEELRPLFVNRERNSKKEWTLSSLYRALGDELRIQMAKQIILDQPRGSRNSVFQPPAGVSPGEYLDFYRTQRTSLKVSLLPVPVQSFTESVTRTPRESELKELFERYRTEEPKPWSLTPGFKRPHKIALQWIALDTVPETTFARIPWALPMTAALRNFRDPREEHYLDVAKTIINLGRNPLPLVAPPIPALGVNTSVLRAWLDVLPIIAPPTPALGVPAPSLPSLLLGVPDRLKTAYLGEKSKYPVPSLFRGDPALSYYTALAPTSVVAGTVAQMVPSGTLASFFNPLVTSQVSSVARARQFDKDGKLIKDLQEPAIKEERQIRATVVAGLTGLSVGGTSLGRWAPWVWADTQESQLGFSFSTQKLPETVLNSYVSQEGIRFQVSEIATRKLAFGLPETAEKDLITLELQLLEDELQKKKDDPREFEKALREAMKKRPWLKGSTGESGKPIDPYEFLTAPELLSLRLRANFDPTRTEAEQLRSVSNFFSTDTKVYVPQALGNLIYWKTKDIPASTPGDYQEVRDQVIEAWKMQEARKLAREEADRIRKLVNEKSPDKVLALLRKELASNPAGDTLISLDEVTRLVPKPVAIEGPIEYEDFKPPRDKIPYPPENLVDLLLRLKEGQAAVIQDLAGKHYYVAYVEKRNDLWSTGTGEKEQEKNQETILRELRREVLASQHPKSTKKDLWSRMTSKQQADYANAVLRELRREAGEINAEGRFKGVKSDERDRRGGGSEGFIPGEGE